MILLETSCFCAGCHRPIAAEEVPEAVVIHPNILRLWEVVHTIHPRPRCLTGYRIMRPLGAVMPTSDPLTVAELEHVAGMRVVGMKDDRGYARLVEREEVA